MLSEKVRYAVGQMMAVGCFLRMYPYAWDPLNYRLLKASKAHIFFYHIYELFALGTFTFMTYRLLQTSRELVPPRIRIMNLIWVLAYALVLMCNAQFNLRRTQILGFANTLFESREEERRVKLGRIEEEHEAFDWISLTVLISSFLLVTNPPAHGTVLFSTPCAPQYMSSLYFSCESYGETEVSMIQALPFVLWEVLIIGDMMFLWTFNYTLVFLGIQWIQAGTKTDSSPETESEVSKLKGLPKTFRTAQIKTILLNDAFRLYLQWFPSVLFSIAGMLLFGSIKYSTNVGIHSYIVFPFCGLRCLFEASTCLAIAGNLNSSSGEFLAKWDAELSGSEDRTAYWVTFSRAVRKSCANLKCTAGSLYTFENSIVLVSLHNCFQLTLNLLVTYDKNTSLY